jgi:hypothetical protein
MPTQEPSQNSPNDPTSTPMTDEEIAAAAYLDTIHADLKKEGVEPTGLMVVTVGEAEMLIGECYDHGDYVVDGTHSSIFQRGPFVSLKNPKRMTRLQAMNRQTGQVSVQLQFGDLDFIGSGIIEVRPVAAFFLDWCDYGTQVRYCKAYLGYIEGRKKAMAEAAGLILPGAPQTPSSLHRG